MPLMQGPPGPYTMLDGRRRLYFAGTGYLGMQSHAAVTAAAAEAAGRYGIGAATGRGGFGTTPLLIELEEALARFFDKEAALTFSSGYLGGAAVTQAIADAFDAVFLDEHAHDSLHDAARMVDASRYVFAHRDAQDLRLRIRRHLGAGGRPLVMTDGVFAARGHVAPVKALCDVLADFDGAALLVDDAHGVGTMGPHGRGSFEHAGLHERVNAGPTDGGAGPALYQCGTLSKALGGYGGVTAGAKGLMDRLRDRCRFFRGASALPAPVVGAARAALAVLAEKPQLLSTLRDNALYLKLRLREAGFDAGDEPSPIAALEIGDAADMRRIHESLLDRDIAIGLMTRYAGVGPCGALRIAVFATHTHGMIDRLVEALAGVC